MTDLFDEATEDALRHFQQRRGLTADGRVGEETYRALQAARFRLGDRLLGHSATHLVIGDDVGELQRQLMEIGYAIGRIDGHFGPKTAGALKSFQRDMGLLPDGVCGPVSLRALRQLEARRVVGGRPQMLREMMAVADAGPNLLGKRIVLDPGHGGADLGVTAGTLCEAEIVYDIATRLEGRLSALGVTALLSRGRSSGGDDDARAQFANGQGADLVLSLHIDTAPSEHPNGVATYYYGGEQAFSTIGERFAYLVQREVVARTGMLDGRTHPKTWTLLRLTSMPTVRVELGYLSSAHDSARLAQAEFRNLIVESLLAAIQRLYLPQELDPPTGVLKLPAHSR
jgi:N-acetylmuramoyl-L-alanine amidase